MADATAGPGESVTAWLARLRERLPSGTRELTPSETAALLDLAREAAHHSERIAAPLTTFLVGVALHDLPADERAGRIRALIAELADLGQKNA